MSGLEKKWRFQLPDNWQPTGTVCVMFTVPDDPEYIRQIIGLVDALKFSKNFGRDPTRTGAAIVSRTWGAALESEPVRVVDCDSGEGIDDVAKIRHRPKPGQPWITQEKYDDEPDWYDAHIQPHWGASSISDAPPVNNSRDAMGESDRLIRGVWQWQVDQILNLRALGVDRTTGVNAIMGQAAGYVTDPTATREAIGKAWDTIGDLPTPTANSYSSAATDEECCERYWELWNRIADAFAQSPSAATDKIMDMIQDGINNGINQTLTDLSRFAQQLGDKIREFAEQIGNGSAGEDRFLNCDWAMVWDFLTTDGKWSAGIPELNIGCEPANWANGIGWQGNVPCEEGDDIWYSAVIRIKFPATWITTWEVTVDFDSPSLNSLTMKAIGENGTEVVESVGNQANNEMNPTPLTEWPVQFIITANSVNYAQVHIIESIAGGKGYNPFAPELTDGSPPW